MTTGNDIWQQRGNDFYPATTATEVKRLRPGVYQWASNIGGWHLEAISEKFVFPFKIYGHHDHILSRIQTAWDAFDSNLGVMLNGTKGAGKTVTAQLISNWALAKGMPVLLVHSPIPLLEVLAAIHQPILVFFDEFEKTHEENEDNKPQQALLTALDGTARAEHKHIFLLTTNSKTLNENFEDRPSRIRYCWEFLRLTDDVVEDLMDDLLNPELKHLRSSLSTYLSTRRVLSLDVAKAVIQEVNAFKQDPTEFEGVLNLTEQFAKGFVLEILDEDRKPVRTITHYFMPSNHEMGIIRNAMTRSGHEEFNDTMAHRSYTFQDRATNVTIELLEATDALNEFVCHVGLPFFETWVRKFPKLEAAHHAEFLWMDEMPKGWKVPSWAQAYQDGETLKKQDESAFSTWRYANTVFGGDNRDRQKVIVRISPNLESRVFKYAGVGDSYDMNAM